MSIPDSKESALTEECRAEAACANPRQVTHRMTAATLVNELVEQGKFLERGDIGEAEFIAAVNHYVKQFAASAINAELLEAAHEVAESYAAGFREDALWESVEKLCAAIAKATGL